MAVLELSTVGGGGFVFSRAAASAALPRPEYGTISIWARAGLAGSRPLARLDFAAVLPY